MANANDNNISVIDAASNTVIGAPIVVGLHPFGIAVTPAGTLLYVANEVSNTVSVIDAATNTVIGAPIAVGNTPHAFGLFIGGAATPPAAPSAIPTLSERSLLVLAGLLSVLAVGALGRKRQAVRRQSSRH